MIMRQKKLSLCVCVLGLFVLSVAEANAQNSSLLRAVHPGAASPCHDARHPSQRKYAVDRSAGCIAFECAG